MVLENLLDNASKYSHDNKTVTIILEQSKDQTIITIADAGVGILPKDQKKMFMKFSRLDNSLSLSTTGTGLGLYWVSKIVGLHQGTIAVTSKVGQGTSFTLTLPMLSSPTIPKVVELI
jgi:signal transduction histidine kinase